MGILRLFQGKAQIPASLEKISVDMHSHLLPGIDDGAPSMDHTLGMLRKMEELGFKKLIMTPHVMSGVYDNTTELIREKLKEVKHVAAAHGIKLELEASAEYFFDETLFQRITRKDLLPFNGNHILFEFSFRNKPERVEDLVFQLKAAGYQPVVAHFERYMYFHPNLDMARMLRERGCLIQANWNSFTGHYGKEIKVQAERLLKADLIDVLGTDCHRIEHLFLLEHFLKTKFARRILDKQFRNSSF